MVAIGERVDVIVRRATAAVMRSSADSPGRTATGTSWPLNFADEPFSWKLATVDCGWPIAVSSGQSATAIWRDSRTGSSRAMKSLFTGMHVPPVWQTCMWIVPRISSFFGSTPAVISIGAYQVTCLRALRF